MPNKDPAFLFYPKDWLQGTANLMPEEKGIYIDLLCHQHQNTDLPNDTKRLSRMVGLSESEFLPIWEVISKKFKLNSVNQLVNQKLSNVVNRRLTDVGYSRVITGTFASVIRLSDISIELKEKIKKEFVYTDFQEVPKDQLTQRLTDWLTERSTEWLTNRLTKQEPNVANAINNGINKEFIVEKKVENESFVFWTSEKKSFLNAGDWIYKFCTSKSITVHEFDKQANIFLQDVELKEDYKTVKELKSHFTNWYNLKNKIGANGGGFKKPVEDIGVPLKKL